ncbi:family 78 glycoside hydrolase catalytic domain [Olivibacter sp. SDN3]|uniref:family 78 glycoside hydrolase catalytic domain n=1 Tax=Olivibacter sp. SDN3 TaxID=2764720 RepID=UPI0016513A53|nr:family 78 glycoside hydrolase catalytic domain [Olivibacter sp. SDN3]QNL52260.1 family 78 glycoside hydrolase catalytic domain [Olivibacter sp. SDN3]
MSRMITVLIIVCCCKIAFSDTLAVTNLRVDYKRYPKGLVTYPKFSWELQSGERNTHQRAYRILVADHIDSLAIDKGNIWDSGKVASNASNQVLYEGRTLLPTKSYHWKVKVWDNHEKVSAWSESTHWQMGLFNKTDWKSAQWITYNELASDRIDPLPKSDKKDSIQDNNILPLFRRSFQVQKRIARATLFISGLGHFELHLNGQKIGDHFLDAGWTKYDSEVLYETFDVSKYLRLGENAIGVLLGNGFYYIPPVKGRYRKQKVAFGYPKMIARLHIVYTDGSSDDMVSDEQWKTDKSPITFSSIYGGEDYDARLEQPGWDSTGFDDKHWQQAIVTNGVENLKPQTAEPVKVFEQFDPKKTMRSPKGDWIVDLGQNASGVVSLTVKGNAGDTVRIYPGELLQDGAVTQKATGGPFYFEYVLKGGEEENWQPRFSYYGFRYLELRGAVPKGVENPSKQAEIIALRGLHIRNAAEEAGIFHSSNDLFNRTHRLIDWAIKSNMVSVFTDCPHREKLGWLEQTHLMGASARYRYDIATLLRKTVNDMMLSQLPNGLVPEIAPEFVEFTWGGEMFRDSPEWGSASIILPWYLYKWYGNKEVLETAYPMMKKYMGYLAGKSENHLLKQGLGDWYDLGPEPPGVSQLTPMGVTGSAIYYYNLQILIEIAEMLDHETDRARFISLAKKVKEAFNKAFFNPSNKQYATGSQTANAMAVYMGLVEPEHKEAVVHNLIQDIRQRGNSLTAGDIGYRYVLRVLEEEGRSDVIYDMNSRSDVPGYGYQLAKGATALTESWQASERVSNNHFMLGHLMEWLYSGLAGIKQQEEGIAFNKIKIQPEVVGDISAVKAVYHSIYGDIRSSWEKKGDQFELKVRIPTNTEAKIYLPIADNYIIYEGNRHLEQVGIPIIGDEKRRKILAVGSGDYHFVVKEGASNPE